MAEWLWRLVQANLQFQILPREQGFESLSAHLFSFCNFFGPENHSRRVRARAIQKTNAHISIPKLRYFVNLFYFVPVNLIVRLKVIMAFDEMDLMDGKFLYRWRGQSLGNKFD